LQRFSSAIPSTDDASDSSPSRDSHSNRSDSDSDSTSSPSHSPNPIRTAKPDLLAAIIGTSKSASPQQQQYLRLKSEERARRLLSEEHASRSRAALLDSIRVLHEDYDYAFLYKPSGMPNTGKWVTGKRRRGSVSFCVLCFVLCVLCFVFCVVCCVLCLLLSLPCSVPDA
jgi:hypothetical protein